MLLKIVAFFGVLLMVAGGFFGLRNILGKGDEDEPGSLTLDTTDEKRGKYLVRRENADPREAAVELVVELTELVYEAGNREALTQCQQLYKMLTTLPEDGPKKRKVGEDE